MRRSLSLLLLILFTLSAQAADPPKPGSASPHHARETWEQHFAQANQAHDGHLTLEEAQGGFALVAKHFDDIDVHRKGYVTQNDVRAWRVMKKAAHRLTQPPPEDRLKPRNAVQLGPVGRTAVSASVIQTVAIPGISSRRPDDGTIDPDRR